MHFAKTGYENLAGNILNVSNSLREKVSAPSNVSDSGTGGHFWRGFVSPTGALKPAFTSSGYNRQRAARGRTLASPYRSNGTVRGRVVGGGNGGGGYGRGSHTGRSGWGGGGAESPGEDTERLTD